MRLLFKHLLFVCAHLGYYLANSFRLTKDLSPQPRAAALHKERFIGEKNLRNLRRKLFSRELPEAAWAAEILSGSFDLPLVPIRYAQGPSVGAQDDRG